MRKVLREIGIRKALRYAWGQCQSGLLANGLILPPFRIVFLRIFGAKIGRDCVIEPMRFFNVYRTGFSGCVVGDNCFIGTECLFDLAEHIVCEDYVTFAQRVTVLTHMSPGYASHPLQQLYPARQAPVRFGRGCFIGANCTVLCGVTVGEGAVVAAGSVVTEDIPPHTLCAGIPARVVKRIDTSIVS